MFQEYVRAEFPTLESLLENKNALQRTIDGEISQCENLRRELFLRNQEFNALKAKLFERFVEDLRLLEQRLPELWTVLRQETSKGFEGSDPKAAAHLKRLNSLKKRQGSLKLQREYLQLAQAVTVSCEEFKRVLGSKFDQSEKPEPRASLLLTAYNELFLTAEKIGERFPTLSLAEEAQTLLLNQFKEISCLLADDLGAMLEALGWPVKPVKYTELNLIAAEQLQQFKTSFKRAGLLQYPPSYPRFFPHINYGVEPASGSSVFVHFGIVQMCQALKKRFQFHFMSSRPTNRLDKPEWFFSDVIKTVSTNAGFIDAVLAPLIKETPNRTTNFYSPFLQMTLSILEFVYEKIVADIELLKLAPEHVAHYLSEASQFDRFFKQIIPSDVNSTVKVLVSEPSLLNAFLQHTLLEETKKFREYMKPGVAWDFIGLSLISLQPSPNGGRFLHSVDALSNHVLLSFAQKYGSLGSARLTRSLFNCVQLFLMEKFLYFVNLLLQQAESKIGRPWFKRRESDIASLTKGPKMQTGSDSEREDARSEALPHAITHTTNDVVNSRSSEANELLERLSEEYRQEFNSLLSKYSLTGVLGRVCCALENLQQVMLDCSEHDYYYALAKSASHSESPFEALIGDYKRLQLRAERLLAHDLVRQIKNSWSDYKRKKVWPSLVVSQPKEVEDTNLLSDVFFDPSLLGTQVSPELQPGLITLSNNLENSLLSLLSRQALRKSVVPLLASSIENWIFTNVFFAQQFSESMACQVYTDLTCGVLPVLLVGRTFSTSLLRKAIEMARLLALPSVNSPRSKILKVDVEQIASLLVSSESSSDDSGLAAARNLSQKLESIGVFNQSSSEIKDILRRRVDCPAFL